MKTQNRLKMVYINSFLSFAAQFCQIFVGFLVRKVFIHQLGVSYLGYHSVFNNLLQMLNLADMGISVAVTSYLYKPLAEGNQKQIAAILFLYKRIYQILGVLVAVIGAAVSVFLPAIIKDAQVAPDYLRILFYIHLAGTVSSYYLAYNRTLYIADQKSYQIAVIDTASYFLFSAAQILLLLKTPHYILFLSLAVLKNVTSNMILSLKCRHDYRFLKTKADPSCMNEYKQPIFHYVKDVFLSRIGAFVYYGTDNLIISMIKGSVITGYLSNYTMITGYVNTLFSQMLNSLQASFGHYINIESDLSKKEQMTRHYLCANYLVGNFCMICLMFLFHPFISLIFGNQFLMETSTSVLLSVNLMLTLMIQLPSQLFVIYRLYQYDKKIVFLSAFLNIVISIVGVSAIGVNGALIGTTFTSLIYLYSRYYIVCKKVYQAAYYQYIAQTSMYFLVSLINVIAVMPIGFFLSGNTYITFFFRACLVGLLAVLVPVLLLCRTKEVRFLFKKIVSPSWNKISKKIHGGGGKT